MSGKGDQTQHTVVEVITHTTPGRIRKSNISKKAIHAKIEVH